MCDFTRLIFFSFDVWFLRRCWKLRIIKLDEFVLFRVLIWFGSKFLWKYPKARVNNSKGYNWIMINDQYEGFITLSLEKLDHGKMKKLSSVMGFNGNVLRRLAITTVVAKRLRVCSREPIRVRRKPLKSRWHVGQRSPSRASETFYRRRREIRYESIIYRIFFLTRNRLSHTASWKTIQPYFHVQSTKGLIIGRMTITERNCIFIVFKCLWVSFNSLFSSLSSINKYSKRIFVKS